MLDAVRESGILCEISMYDQLIDNLYRAAEMATQFPRSTVVGFDLTEQHYMCAIVFLSGQFFVLKSWSRGNLPNFE